MFPERGRLLFQVLDTLLQAGNRSINPLHFLAQCLHVTHTVFLSALDVCNCSTQRFNVLLRRKAFNAQLLYVNGQSITDLVLFTAAGTDLVHLSL